jgi:ATP synthase protein I
MTDEAAGPISPADRDFVRKVGAMADRKLRAQRKGEQSVWFGLGMSGLIGWSVAVPTVAGAMMGLWWDNHHPGARSWTLMLLTIGLCVGCVNAWHWVNQENKTIQDGQGGKHE